MGLVVRVVAPDIPLGDPPADLGADGGADIGARQGGDSDAVSLLVDISDPVLDVLFLLGRGRVEEQGALQQLDPALGRVARREPLLVARPARDGRLQKAARHGEDGQYPAPLLLGHLTPPAHLRVGGDPLLERELGDALHLVEQHNQPAPARRPEYLGQEPDAVMRQQRIERRG